MPADERIEKCMLLCRTVWYPFEVKYIPAEGIVLTPRRGVSAVVALDVGQNGMLSYSTEQASSPRQQRRFDSFEKLRALLEAL